MSLLSRLAVQAARAYGILSSRSNNISADFLVVAGGGGGGGGNITGGGGAGGFRTSAGTSGGGSSAESKITLSTLNTYSIVVGAGGNGGPAGDQYNGYVGSNSSISGTGLSTVTSIGGGNGGGSGANVALTTGGSGGGATGVNGTPGSGTTGQGYIGGTKWGTYAGGGGGGAGAAGGGVSPGNGGTGVASSISGSSVTYAGGGGAGGQYLTSGTFGAGGTGGGGNGGTGGGNNVGLPGTANTGGGGGGAAYASAHVAGGSGGSGIVIISYTSATPKFVGGTLTTSGGNQIHTFTSSGTLSPITPVSASYLVVAGGGSGGANAAGGGGAGGLLTSSTTIYSGATYVVTVGAGGAGVTGGGAPYPVGISGSNSSLAGTGLTTVTSTGGGGGGSYANSTARNGLNGGSGGGAGNFGGTTDGTAGTGTSGQGNNGGASFASNFNGGGGGGASAVGGNATSPVAGTGGAGTASSISGSSVTYAGGGGGGTGNGTSVASGGAGGGGAGGSTSPTSAGTAGTANTGGGGGGSCSGASGSGSGGSGVVIISYAGSQAFNGGLVTSSGGNTIHTFTSTGALTPLTNNLNNSLRFRSSASAYLNRTPTLAGNRTTWTWSAWVKRGAVGTTGRFISVGTAASDQFGFLSTDTFQFVTDSTSQNLVTTQVFRDPSAWYHIVVVNDTTQATASNRVKLYVNGNQVTAFSTATYPAQNSTGTINSVSEHNIGRRLQTAGEYFDGYMTDINFIDGQALEPYYFGNNDANGVWKPILYKGTYGTNGFYLPFGSSNFSLPISPTSGTGFATYAGKFVSGSTGTQANLPNNATNLAIGSGDFTVEGWVNTTTNGRGSLIGIGAVNTAGSLWFGWENDTTSYIRFGATDVISSGLSLSSAGWVHIALTRSGSTVRLYKNGSLVTSGTSSTNLNLTDVSAIGGYGASTPSSYTLEGFISNLRLVVGTALYTGSTYTIPTSALTAVSGTQLLTLQNSTLIDNSANNYTMTAVIPFALDASGNTNYWQMVNMNVSTAGTTYDAMTDVPTNTSATVANYCVINPIASAVADTYSQANLKWTKVNNSTNSSAVGSIAISSGKWYWEGTVAAVGGSNLTIGIGNTDTNFVSLDSNLGMTGSTTSYAYNGGTGPYKQNNNTQTSYGATYTANDVIGVAFDADAGTITFYKNNVSQGTAYTGITGTYYPACGGRFTNDSWYMNFGQRPFSYTPPSGFVALNTFNLPTPTILQGNKYMDATLFTATSGAQSIVNQGQFKPDLVWTKSRSNAQDHYVVDSVRGGSSLLRANTTAAENTSAVWISSFNSNGFSTDSASLVTPGYTYVGWQWQAGQGSTSSNTSGSITSTVSVNTTAGFSVVTFNSTSASGTSTIGHGLGVTPAMLIMKDRTSAYGWDVWTKGLGAITNSLILSSTAAVSTTRQPFGSVSPTSSVFTFNNAFYAAASDNIVVYAWAEIAGFSKFGSYTGNGSADGPFVYTGFRPKYVMIKRTDGVGPWYVLDSVRNTYNVMNLYVEAQDSAAEATFTFWDFVSNGFKLRTSTTNINGSSQSFIYMAFAENPFKNANAR
jgi:hypothetical protein